MLSFWRGCRRNLKLITLRLTKGLTTRRLDLVLPPKNSPHNLRKVSDSLGFFNLSKQVTDWRNDPNNRQVGDGDADHASWGRPEDMSMARPAFKISPKKPGTDLAAETAAAMAAGAIAFKKTNPQYAQLLIRHAKELFEFADKYRGVYSRSIPKAAPFYKSSGGNDELAWAAAWIYRYYLVQSCTDWYSPHTKITWSRNVPF